MTDNPLEYVHLKPVGWCYRVSDDDKITPYRTGELIGYSEYQTCFISYLVFSIYRVNQCQWTFVL